MTLIVKSALHRFLKAWGIDIVRWHKAPENTLLGLTEVDIRTVFDIGANIGQSARFYRQMFPDARIYSFEPLPAAYSQLYRWSLGQNGKVQALNVALGDRTGPMKMKEHVDYSPSSSFLESTNLSHAVFPQTSRQQDTQVEMFRLDDIAKDLKIESEILVKMDVQGYEDRLIRGGKKTIGQAVACIMEVSLQPLYQGQPTFKKLCDSMHNLGFEYAGNILQIYDQHGRVIYLDALFRKPVQF